MRAGRIAHEPLRAPDTDAAAAPPPRFLIPTTKAAAIAKVAASTKNKTVGEPGCNERIAPARPNPRALATIVVAATIAFALPTCPTGTRPGIAAWRAGCTIALMLARTSTAGKFSHQRIATASAIAT